MPDEKIETRRPEFYGAIKTYQIRIGRMTDAQRKNYAELSPKWGVPFKNEPLDFAALFANGNPVTIEIGFGMGSATVELAARNPGMNYIGIEVHKPGIGRLLGEVEARGIENLRVIEHDALEVLEAMAADSSVAAFHIFFPDPWQKKRHHKRRLVRRPNTDLLARKLMPGGYICMATDWEEYAESALEELSATPGLKNKYDGFAPRQRWRPETKFESRAIRYGRAVKDLLFEKA